METIKLKRLFFTLIFITSVSEFTFGQLILINEMPRSLYYDRTPRIKKAKDWKCVGDVLHMQKYGMRYEIFSGNISQNIGRVIISDSEGVSEIRNATSFFLRTRIIEEVYFNVTLFKDWNPRARAAWLSDFNYSFGRYNWRPKTWSYGYENFAPNKYNDSPKKLLGKFLQGNFFVAYNNGILQRLMEKVHLGNANFTISPFFRYSFQFVDAMNNTRRDLGKPAMGISARYNIYKGLYAEGAVYGYLSPMHKQPWDPDFTYGFGWFDWRPFRLSATYGNWVINRFPWNEKPFPNYGFLDGNFRVIFNWAW